MTSVWRSPLQWLVSPWAATPVSPPPLPPLVEPTAAAEPPPVDVLPPAAAVEPLPVLLPPPELKPDAPELPPAAVPPWNCPAWTLASGLFDSPFDGANTTNAACARASAMNGA